MGKKIHSPQQVLVYFKTTKKITNNFRLKNERMEKTMKMPRPKKRKKKVKIISLNIKPKEKNLIPIV